MNDKVNKRMCLSCRNMFHKAKLVRLAKADGKVFIDKTYKGGGRGAYICSLECLEKVIKGGRINKALRAFADEELYRQIKEILNGTK